MYKYLNIVPTAVVPKYYYTPFSILLRVKRHGGT